MRRAMEYVHWELDNWRTQRHGRDRSIFTMTKVASYMWQSWKRGALVVLVLALLPILFPLVLFLSFFGFISVVLLLCGAVVYYLLFRSFSLPLSITVLFNFSNRPPEGLITGSQSGEDCMLESAPFVVQEVESRLDESSLKTSAIGEEGTEDPGKVSGAKTILLLECKLVENERDEADNREHHSTFKLNVPSEGNQRNSESGSGSSSSVVCHSNAVLQVRGPIFLLPSGKLKSQHEKRKDERTCSVNGTGDDCMAEALKREVADVLSNELSKSDCQKAPIGGMMVSEKEVDVVDANRTCTHFRGHACNGKDCPVRNRTLTGNSEVKTKASVNSTSIPSSYSALLSTPEGIARIDSESITHTVPTRYWRDEVEDTVLSSTFANITCMENRNSGASGDMTSMMSFKSESEKMIMSDQDGVCLLECTGEAEMFSASQTPNSGQYEEKMVECENGRIGSSLRFATSLLTHQRRLSFSNVLADDEIVSPEFFLPRKKFNDFTPDCRKRSVSTSFSSDYTWPSGSSEQGFEFLSTRGIGYEESCVDTASSTAQYEEESDLELDVVSDSTFFPTPDQLTEDWETRRKKWEEESTLGRLAPLSPCIEAHSIEARSMCNPLFEFSTPSPPLKKLNTGDKNHVSNSPSFHARFCK